MNRRIVPSAFVVLILCAPALAQTVQQPVFGNTSVGTTVSAPNFGGIAINADGVVSAPNAVRINPALERKRLREIAEKHLPADMSARAELRKVSLVRLERELQTVIASKRPVPPELRYLAGMTRIDYVIADREHNDLIIAGPAEGFAPTQSGAVVGIESGRPTLVLDDLLVMLRLRTMRQTLGCSFDPDPARLAKAQAWYQSTPAEASAAQAKRQFLHMAELLGSWNVRIFGLPPTSHAAVRMVEADFHMKRINLGLHRTGIRGFKSQLAMMRPDDNSLRRYWFAPRYNQIERSPNGDVYRLSGPRLQLLAQEELADAQGNRTQAAFTEVSTQDYTRQFNRHMEALCRKNPAFAAVQNLFDMAVVVALMQQNQLFQAAGWQPGVLLDARQLPLMQCPAPTSVPSLVNTRTAGRSLIMFQIGGGLTIVPTEIIARPRELPPESIPDMSTTQTSWWWD